MRITCSHSGYKSALFIVLVFLLIPIGKAENIQIKKTSVNQKDLPPPFDYLLTQPLMTPALEQYYHGTAFIQTLSAEHNPNLGTYHRVIRMHIKGPSENNAHIVELAFITMNFNALPSQLISEVLNASIPFGTLLTKHHIPTYFIERRYFSVKCDAMLAKLSYCKLNQTVYGREHVMMSRLNGQWLASVVEILPG